MEGYRKRVQSYELLSTYFVLYCTAPDAGKKLEGEKKNLMMTYQHHPAE